MFNFVHLCTNYRKYKFLIRTSCIFVKMMSIKQDNLLNHYVKIIEVKVQLNFINHNTFFLLNDYYGYHLTLFQS